jgi:hypothetical protein
MLSTMEPFSESVITSGMNRRAKKKRGKSKKKNSASNLHYLIETFIFSSVQEESQFIHIIQ